MKTIATTNRIVYAKQMQFRFFLLPAFLVSLTACSTEPKAAAFEPPAKHGVIWRVLHPFGESSGKKETPRSGVQLTIEPDNATPSLAAVRQVKLKILVTNYTRKMVSLAFPTSQRIEIIARSAEGKIFYTYSTDRAFTQELSNLSINPGERLEYNENLPLRTMVAGNTYLVTASVVGQASLENTISITPQL